LTLLYVGIAPAPPRLNDGPPSRASLRSRIRYHYTGNASGSTLRFTLGCLLAARLGIQLRRVGSKSLTFGHGEGKLDDWMRRSAFVCWHKTAEPWLLEEWLIPRIDLPLYLAGNASHAFHPTLTALRAEARQAAQALPVLKRRASHTPLGKTSANPHRRVIDP
jgi:hypothetical protein